MTSRRGRNPLHLPPSSYEGDRVGLSWCFLLAPKSRPPIMLYCTGGPGKVWREKNWREFYKERKEEEVPCPSASIPQVCLWVSNSSLRCWCVETVSSQRCWCVETVSRGYRPRREWASGMMRVKDVDGTLQQTARQNGPGKSRTSHLCDDRFTYSQTSN